MSAVSAAFGALRRNKAETRYPDVIIYGMAAAELVSTADAARMLGIDRATLSRWARQGLVHPTYTTPGGQYRWDLEDLRRQLKLRPK
jgi:helix-turn-helix protein